MLLKPSSAGDDQSERKGDARRQQPVYQLMPPFEDLTPNPGFGEGTKAREIWFPLAWLINGPQQTQEKKIINILIYIIINLFVTH